MKLKLNKKKLKNLSNDASALPADMTPQVAGGGTVAKGGPPEPEHSFNPMDCNSMAELCQTGHECMLF